MLGFGGFFGSAPFWAGRLAEPFPIRRDDAAHECFSFARDPSDRPPFRSRYAEDTPRHHHALSLIGEPRYPADFKHFDYVNPDAPKGGLVRLSDVGGFDSLNPVSTRASRQQASVSPSKA